MTVLAVFTAFGGSRLHLAILLLVLQNTVPRGDRDGLTVLVVSAVVAVSVVTAIPLKLNPLFRHPKRKGDNDNFCLHLWELWMLYLNYLFHCGRQKRDNTNAVRMLHQMSV